MKVKLLNLENTKSDTIEISDKILMPLRQYIPSAGGLDFSPLFIFILIQFLSGFLNDLLRYVV